MRQNILTMVLGAVLLCIPSHLSYGQGDRYTGSYTKSAAIVHKGKSNFTIEGFEFSNINGNMIELYECENVIIRNNKFSFSGKNGIYLYKCKNITVIDNTFENVQSGLRASLSQGIQFEYNDVSNIIGKLKGSNELGVMAQFIQVSGANNSISYNVCENIPNESSTEDIINLYNSSGTQGSPILVKGNWLRGGGPSESGGGINLGDMSGSYQIAEDNILVDPGQYGVAISGGKNMTLRNNKVYARSQYFTNVGIIASNWYEQQYGKSSAITVENNSVNYHHRDGWVNNWWFNQNMNPIIGKETNVYDPNLSASILPERIIGRARSASTTDPETPPTPDIQNDPSILIYIDSYNRICINCHDRLSTSANVTVSDESGNVLYSSRLTRFHTVLPNRPTPGNYTILAKNGEKVHQKTLNIQ